MPHIRNTSDAVYLSGRDDRDHDPGNFVQVGNAQIHKDRLVGYATALREDCVELEHEIEELRGALRDMVNVLGRGSRFPSSWRVRAARWIEFLFKKRHGHSGCDYENDEASTIGEAALQGRYRHGSPAGYFEWIKEERIAQRKAWDFEQQEQEQIKRVSEADKDEALRQARERVTELKTKPNRRGKVLEPDSEYDELVLVVENAKNNLKYGLHDGKYDPQ